MKRKRRPARSKRRPYRPPTIVTEEIFERYALACTQKTRPRSRGFMT